MMFCFLDCFLLRRCRWV